MFYKPTYCCNCGDKIEQIGRHLLSSRRFCELCETDFQFGEWTPRVIVVLALIFGSFGVGTYISNSKETITVSNSPAHINPQLRKFKTDFRESKTQKIKEKQLETAEINVDKNKIISEKSTIPSDRVSGILPGKVKKVKTVKKVYESKYFCGAETKKGTPCSRKVKGKKRCWQHEGREAMLSQKELLTK